MTCAHIVAFVGQYELMCIFCFGHVTGDSDVPGEGGDLYAHFTQITDGNQLEPGSKVEFVKTYNDFKGKWCAQTITGGKAGVAPVTDVMVLAPTIAPRPGSIAHRVQGPTPGEPVSLAGRNWLHLAKSQGIVVQWDKRGFGFVRPHHGGADLFIHFSEILDGNWLDPGAQVAFIREFHGLHGLSVLSCAFHTPILCTRRLRDASVDGCGYRRRRRYALGVGGAKRR